MVANLPATTPPAKAQQKSSSLVLRLWSIKFSLLSHGLLLLSLAGLLIPPRKTTQVPLAIIAHEDPPEPPVITVLVPTPPEPTGLQLVSAEVPSEIAIPTPSPVSDDLPNLPELPPPPLPEPPTEQEAPDSSIPAPEPEPEQPADLPTGGGLDGREPAARAQLVQNRGGTPASEMSVVRGLTWLAAHQQTDGSWHFDHDSGPCQGRCRHGGREKSTTAATALALLPYLGAGQTSLEGEHRGTVARGLAYLRGKLILSARGGDLQDGSMYGQGLAAMALSEAAAMTGDAELRESAQAALRFIVSVQHPAGGWRYFPGQAGDTTVVGWQWMALRSGQLASLPVPPETIARAGEFLDSVQADDGAAYGYQRADTHATATAIGLLCRMYSGWRRSDPRLARGVERLVAHGPSQEDMYFNFYATQVLHHYEGPHWEPWNERLREHLIATQAELGHEQGSWHFADSHTASGGRLCDTALCLLTLEVYYRYLPLYGWLSVEL